MATASEANALGYNLKVDYVIHFSFGDSDKAQAIAQLEKLLRTLANAGLQCEVRQGDETSLLVFVRASKKRLNRAVYRSRVRDWLYGIRNAEPEPASSIEPQNEGERLRVINHMITLPTEEGGAGITPNHGEWKNVTGLLPLHDEETNKKWLQEWSQKTFLSEDDLDQIRAKFGESVGFYFAFLQSYFRFLIFPAVFGFSCWFLLGGYSVVYTLVNSLWCIVFVEYWKRKEVDLSCRWQTKGVSAVETKRREFKPEKEVRDEGTGEMRGVFPATKRMQRQLLQIPFALLSAIGLGIIIATCFAIEIFIAELYSGPLKSYLVFIPTILLSALVPTMSAVLISVATKLNDYENHETDDAYDTALTQKVFVINFITSYLPILLTAFVYVPFASHIVPYLDIFRLTIRPFVSEEHATTADCSHFKIDPHRLRNQVIYFTVTAQIVGFAMETIVPYIKQHALREYKAYNKKKNGQSGSNGDKDSPERSPIMTYDDPIEEKEFLKRVRNEVELPEYKVTDDLREMCIQFGYLALFSPTWPLVPLSFFINNWIELRSDFFKICMEFRRPTPLRCDTIGPWLDTLGFLSWVGSITSAALLYMFCGDNQRGPNGEPTDIKGWALLLVIFFSEHLYLIVRYAVQTAMNRLEPPNARKERGERYLMRKRYLESTLNAEAIEGEKETEDLVSDVPPELTRSALEEDARRNSGHSADPAERFWMRQRGWTESAKVGAGIIQAQPTRSNVKKQQ